VELITKAIARAQGRKRYYTGKTCKHGHTAPRYVTTGSCCACMAMYARERRRDKATFMWDLHPDDVEAARAYCLALDLQRACMPAAPVTPTPAPVTDDYIPEELTRAIK